MLRSRFPVVVIIAALTVTGLVREAGAAPAGASADTTQPTISIVTPSTGATLSMRTVLDAVASDDVGVTGVEYRLTGGDFVDYPIGHANPTIDGWVYHWDLRGCPDGTCDGQHSVSVPNGTYSLAAVAFDAAENVGRSPAITITIAAKVRIVAPANGAVIRESVTLVADTADLPGVVRVFYLVDLNGLMGSNSRRDDGRWSARWNTKWLENGSHWLQVAAINAADEVVGYSQPVAFVTDNDRTAPTSRVVVPSNRATVSGMQTLAASASDKSRCAFKPECGVGVTQVVFHIKDGRDPAFTRNLGAARPTKFGWVLSWDTASVPAGTYTLITEAFDTNGNHAFSYPGIRITTRGPARPGVRIVLPAARPLFVRGKVTLDADAWGRPNVTRVEYRISGNGHNDSLLGAATKTFYGWIYVWNTASVRNAAIYEVTAVAFNAKGKRRSGPITLLVWN